MKRLYWRALDRAYALVRPLFVRDVDPNEDYRCCVCGKPVLRRYLTCSKRCGELFDDPVWWVGRRLIEAAVSE